MKIAIIGYGKMGKMIEHFAKERGHEVTARIDVDNMEEFDSPAFRTADIAIEFTVPSSAPGNIRRAFEAGVPVVSGTTGWTSLLPDFEKECRKGKGTLLWSSNFSVGVNIFRMVNRYLAGIMRNFPQYHAVMEETHHIHKLDHPSGTALTLAQDLQESHATPDAGWHEVADLEKALKENGKSLPIAAKREGEVPGIHTIVWDSPVDSITISHSAKSREGFALGAVLAAEWLAGKKGFFSMDQVVNDWLK